MSIKKVAVYLWQSRTQIAVMLLLVPSAALILSICALPLVCAVAASQAGRALHHLLSGRWSCQCYDTFMAASETNYRASGEEQDVQTYRCSDTSELAINGAEELVCLIKNRVNELSPDLGDEPGATLCSAAAPDPLRRRWEEDEEDQAAAGSMFTNPLFEFESTSSSSTWPNYKSPTSFRKLSRLCISHSTSPSSRCKCELQVRKRKEICATCGTRTRVSHPFPWR